MADPESESSSHNHSSNQPTNPSSPSVDDLLGGQSPSDVDSLTRTESAKDTSDAVGEYTTTYGTKHTPIPLAPSFISGKGKLAILLFQCGLLFITRFSNF
jgi:hypothetical protein